MDPITQTQTQQNILETKKTSVAFLVAAIIAIIALVVFGYYFLRFINLTYSGGSSPSIRLRPANSFTIIENDLNSIDFSSIDKEVSDIEKELQNPN